MKIEYIFFIIFVIIMFILLLYINNKLIEVSEELGEELKEFKKEFRSAFDCVQQENNKNSNYYWDFRSSKCILRDNTYIKVYAYDKLIEVEK